MDDEGLPIFWIDIDLEIILRMRKDVFFFFYRVHPNSRSDFDWLDWGSGVGIFIVQIRSGITLTFLYRQSSV